ncbi:MAG: glycosyltransferase [Clostridia bacterium]|nr:glycosyltransferase [Clostridia bacterium]
MRALIFSVSIGAGHDLAARGVANEIMCQNPGSEVEIVDTFEYINPILHKVVLGSYIETLKFNPKVWGYLYEQAENGDRLFDFGQILNKLFSPKLANLVKKFAPDVILSTHAFPCGMLSVLKQKNRVAIPVVGIITDFTIHPFWIHDHIDRYVIPSWQLKYILMEMGFPEEKIWPLGLPIRRQFNEIMDKAVARTVFNLTDRPTVLVMGGGLGLGSMEDIVFHLGNSDLDLQIVVVTGNNKKLRQELEHLQVVNQPVVLGYVDQMATLMQAADVIITKPGGLTTAEVLTSSLPMIIVSPIPGQEERNTDFLLNNGVALKARHTSELVILLKQLLNNPLRITQMQEMARHLSHPHAAREIVARMKDEFFSDSL